MSLIPLYEVVSMPLTAGLASASQPPLDAGWDAEAGGVRRGGALHALLPQALPDVGFFLGERIPPSDVTASFFLMLLPLCGIPAGRRTDCKNNLRRPHRLVIACKIRLHRYSEHEDLGQTRGCMPDRYREIVVPHKRYGNVYL